MISRNVCQSCYCQAKPCEDLRGVFVHICEGVLSAPVLLGGAALSAGGVAIGLRRMDYDRIPQVALLSSAFFVASLARVPVGPASAHLVLTGMTGVLLGWAAFPAFLVALFLQAVLLQHGGLTTLGVNTFNMAFPAVVCCALFSAATRSRKAYVAAAGGFLAGSLGVALAGVFTSASLVAAGESFREVALALLLSHIPVMLVEGCVTVALVGFLRRTRPELLSAPLLEEKAVA